MEKKKQWGGQKKGGGGEQNESPSMGGGKKRVRAVWSKQKWKKERKRGGEGSNCDVGKGKKGGTVILQKTLEGNRKGKFH